MRASQVATEPRDKVPTDYPPIAHPLHLGCAPPTDRPGRPDVLQPLGRAWPVLAAPCIRAAQRALLAPTDASIGGASGDDGHRAAQPPAVTIDGSTSSNT
jgi:hypothetical protein